MLTKKGISKMKSGFVKQEDILKPGVLPFSKSTWYRGMETGIFPKPIKYGRSNIWSVDSINEVIQKIKDGTLKLD